jgi:hypothetical protein
MFVLLERYNINKYSPGLDKLIYSKLIVGCEDLFPGLRSVSNRSNPIELKPVKANNSDYFITLEMSVLMPIDLVYLVASLRKTAAQMKEDEEISKHFELFIKDNFKLLKEAK